MRFAARAISFCLLATVLFRCCDSLKPELLQRILYDEPNEQLRELGMVSDKAGSLERTFLSPAHKQAAVKIQQIMEEAGMDAYIDKVANVRGRVRGRDIDAPVLLAGSHYDTVKDAGKFDGMLGILVPIAAVKALLIQAAVDAGKIEEDALLKEPHISLEDYLKHSEITKLIASPIEVIAFSEEEGVRFQTTFLGSRAIVGDLIGSGVLEAEDSTGVSVRESLGLTKDAKSDRFLSNLAYKPDQVRGYVEVHMEQGPILEAKGLPLGVVTGIAGQTRQLVVMSGTQGHAGTIPMPMRKDPMAAAAEAITWMEQRCGGGSFAGAKPPVAAAENLMCTTGSVNLWPNAFNVVPGQANFTLDVRSKNDGVWQSAVDETRSRIEDICRRRGLTCEVQHKNSVNAVHSDEGLLDQLKAAITDSQEVLQSLLPGSGGCTSANGNGKDGKPAVCDSPHSKAVSKREDKPQVGAYTPPALLSGAGHDALKLAELTKMAMMFVRCSGGHSHSPLEHVAEADVAAAAVAMYKFFEAQLLPEMTQVSSA